ncbi:MAG: nonstructural protein [Microvirus sp.]|nr:MAG: nonstructural protein [Microvirus sp.]
MKTQLFCIYDIKAQAFLQPFFSATLLTGQRAFTDACNDANTLFYKHPEDYTLWHIASFDDTSGIITPEAQPQNLGLATQYKGPQS